MGWAFAEVFYDARSRGPVKPISRSLICLNPERAWKVGFDGDLQRYDIRYTLAHEIGHAIGLDHPAGAGQIMDYSYREEFRKLQPGDIAGVLQLYGERRPDKTLASTERMHDNKNRKAPSANNVSAVQRPAYWVRLGEPDKQPGMKAAPSP